MVGTIFSIANENPLLISPFLGVSGRTAG